MSTQQFAVFLTPPQHRCSHHGEHVKVECIAKGCSLGVSADQEGQDAFNYKAARTSTHGTHIGNYGIMHVNVPAHGTAVADDAESASPTPHNVTSSVSCAKSTGMGQCELCA